MDDVLSVLASAFAADAIWEDVSERPQHRADFDRRCKRDGDFVG